MKLIIDIPEEYKALFDTERCKRKFDSLATNEFGYVLRKAFENGTPLDDVKAEIQRTITASWYNGENYKKNYRDGLNDAIEILDNIGKAESEE